ncbi:MAG: hypothetical protein EOO41_05065 [Methanobacteriota archaeon]|nr:MAG: hypothetical protein EOO41_05065 [Euryarchaeota archaeon]
MSPAVASHIGGGTGGGGWSHPTLSAYQDGAAQPPPTLYFDSRLSSPAVELSLPYQQPAHTVDMTSVGSVPQTMYVYHPVAYAPPEYESSAQAHGVAPPSTMNVYLAPDGSISHWIEEAAQPPAMLDASAQPQLYITDAAGMVSSLAAVQPAAAHVQQHVQLQPQPHAQQDAGYAVSLEMQPSVVESASMTAVAPADEQGVASAVDAADVAAARAQHIQEAEAIQQELLQYVEDAERWKAEALASREVIARQGAQLKQLEAENTALLDALSKAMTDLAAATAARQAALAAVTSAAHVAAPGL